MQTARTIVLSVAVLNAAMGLCVLLGWVLDVPILKTVMPGFTTMKANTAIGLVLASVGLAGLDQARALRAPGLAASVLLLALGVATLAQYAWGVRLGIDELVVPDPDSTSMPFPGRMSPATAVAYAASAASLLLLAGARRTGLVVTAHALAGIPVIIGFVSLAGYTYGVDRFYRSGPFMSVAVHTAIGLSLLALGLLAVRAEDGWARRFRGRPIARAALLQIASLSFLVPFLTGLLLVSGMKAGWYEAQFTPALFAVSAALLLVVIGFRAASVLGRAEADVQRARAVARLHQADLEQTRTRHGALVEGLPQLVWTCRPDGRCDYFSPQWVAYTGMAADQQLGFDWLEQVIHPDDVTRTLEHWMGAVSGLHPYDIEYRIRRADGVYHWFKTRATPIRAPGGRITSWFGSCTDIQEIAEARDVLSRSRQELERQVETRTAELMNVEAQLRQSQKMEAVGQLTGGLAHDFNNLLTGISGSLELLQSRIAQGRTAGLDRYVAAAQTGAQRAAALTHRLLAFSRRQTLAPRTTDVRQLVSGMEDMIRRTMGPSIAVEFEAPDDVWTVLVDPGQLENALLNLSINARDAMPDGGLLRIDVANREIDEALGREKDLPPGEYVALSVRDNGSGMPPDVVARAFDPFFTTKPLGQGTGLGLSMIYGFAKQSGGQVRLYSSPDQGTTARILLPRNAGPLDPEQRPGAAAPASHGGGRTMLVVDDEELVRSLVVEVLQEHGYTVLEAADGAGGLARLRLPGPIDLLVTDVGLPGGLNGRQLADAARDIRPDLPVLFITGYADAALLDHAALEPGMQILTKPFTIEALSSRLRDMTEAPLHAEPSAG